MPRDIPRHQVWTNDQHRVLQKLCEENYRFVIQKVPSSYNCPRGLLDTTCRHSECPNKVTLPTSYRASLEKLEDCDPAKRVIGYEAIDSLKNVNKTQKGSEGTRGLGADGQEWWCLMCLEELFVDLRERVWKHKPDGSTRFVHPLTSIQYWIIPEERKIPQFEGNHYTLQRSHIYLIAKWQAVKTFDELRARPAEGHFDLPEDPPDGPVTLYLGRDGESFYLDEETRNLQGLLIDNRVCEIAAHDVRGYSLSEAFRRLDKMENWMVEEKWKPIMAERKRKAREEVEGEGGGAGGQYTEGELIGRDEQQGEPDPTLSVFEGGTNVIPVIYVDNDLSDENRRRRRPHDFTRSFGASASSAAVSRSNRTPTLTRERDLLSPELSVHRAPTTSTHSPEVDASEEVVLSPVSIPHTSIRDSKRVKVSSQSGTNNPVSLTKGVTGVLEADANGGENARTLASKGGLAPSAHPLAPAPQPLSLKFAPNPSSRLCRKKAQNDSRVEPFEEEKQQSGD